MMQAPPPYSALPSVRMMNNPFAMDPNYQHWFHHYGWWHHMVNAQGPNFDIKVARIAYSLAGLLVRDRLEKEDPKNVETLSEMKIKIFDFGLDQDMPTLIENLGAKVE